MSGDELTKIQARIAALRPWPEGEQVIQALERYAAALAARSEPRAEGLREVLLDIGADHENHLLRVVRTEDSAELGPGDWLLVCETNVEDEPLLDFRSLAATLPAPAEPRAEGLPLGIEHDFYDPDWSATPPVPMGSPPDADPALDVERLADAVHRTVCAPLATIDPAKCINGRERDIAVAEDIAREYAALAPPEQPE